ncbi:hypothetical protein [Streptomyces sp. NPDC020681]
MSTRTNLPDSVEVGVEHRNVQVRYGLSNTLDTEAPPHSGPGTS